MQISKIIKENTGYKIYIISFLILVNTFVWYAVFYEDRKGVMTVSFLDVGQGDAIFIDSPAGNQFLLDGGPDKKVLREVGKVMPFYDRKIELIGLSHPHGDHLAGLVHAFSRYKILGYLNSGTITKSSDYLALNKRIDEIDSEYFKNIVVPKGMVIDLGGGAFLDVLMPIEDARYLSPHDGMMVLRLRYGSVSFLLVGDLEKEAEDSLVHMYGEKLKSNVLKVGHHGSKNATKENLLRFVRPKYAVISAGTGNRYGHPSKDVLERLDNMGAKILRTDEKGTIIMKTDGVKIY